MIASTSLAAGRSIPASTSKRLRLEVFKYILYAGRNGKTIEEVSEETGIKLQTVCARRNELDKSGLVIDSGSRRPTLSGRSAKVWIVPDHIAKAARARLAY